MAYEHTLLYMAMVVVAIKPVCKVSMTYVYTSITIYYGLERVINPRSACAARVR